MISELCFYYKASLSELITFYSPEIVGFLLISKGIKVINLLIQPNILSEIWRQSLMSTYKFFMTEVLLLLCSLFSWLWFEFVVGGVGLFILSKSARDEETFGRESVAIKSSWSRLRCLICVVLELDLITLWDWPVDITLKMKKRPWMTFLSSDQDKKLLSSDPIAFSITMRNINYS